MKKKDVIVRLDRYVLAEVLTCIRDNNESTVDWQVAAPAIGESMTGPKESKTCIGRSALQLLLSKSMSSRHVRQPCKTTHDTSTNYRYQFLISVSSFEAWISYMQHTRGNELGGHPFRDHYLPFCHAIIQEAHDKLLLQAAHVSY